MVQEKLSEYRECRLSIDKVSPSHQVFSGSVSETRSILHGYFNPN